MQGFTSSNISYAMVIISLVFLVVVFPLVLRRRFMRLRHEVPRTYCIWITIGYESAALTMFFVGLLGLSGFDFRTPSALVIFGVSAVFFVLAMAGFAVTIYFEAVRAVRLLNRRE